MAVRRIGVKALSLYLSPPDEPLVPKTALLPRSLWERLERISKTTKKQDPKEVGWSRNQVMVKLLLWACDEWEKDPRNK